jgi:hypothetical protein
MSEDHGRQAEIDIRFIRLHLSGCSACSADPCPWTVIVAYGIDDSTAWSHREPDAVEREGLAATGADVQGHH